MSDAAQWRQPEGGPGRRHVPPRRGRLVALDIGDRRTGVAVSDPLQLTVAPYATLKRTEKAKDIEAVQEIVAAHSAVAVVVGHPRLPSGDRGTQARSVEAFVGALRNALRIPVVLWDESYSTRVALERKPGTDDVDAMAAAVILEEWLRHCDTEAKARSTDAGDATREAPQVNELDDQPPTAVEEDS